MENLVPIWIYYFHLDSCSWSAFCALSSAVRSFSMSALLRAAITLAISASFLALSACRSDRIDDACPRLKRSHFLHSSLFRLNLALSYAQPQVIHFLLPPRLTRVPRVLLVFESLWWDFLCFLDLTWTMVFLVWCYIIFKNILFYFLKHYSFLSLDFAWKKC